MQQAQDCTYNCVYDRFRVVHSTIGMLCHAVSSKNSCFLCYISGYSLLIGMTSFNMQQVQGLTCSCVHIVPAVKLIAYIYAWLCCQFNSVPTHTYMHLRLHALPCCQFNSLHNDTAMFMSMQSVQHIRAYDSMQSVHNTFASVPTHTQWGSRTG